MDDIPRPKDIVLEPSRVVLEAAVEVELGTPRLGPEDVVALRGEPAAVDFDGGDEAGGGEAC